MWMKTILLTLISINAYAASAPFTLTLPTANTDGSALDLSDISEVRIYCDDNATPSWSGPPTGLVMDIIVTARDPVAGPHDCNAEVEHTNGNISVRSDMVTKVFENVTPEAPILE